MAITKPSVGATGWNTATDALIDRVNALDAAQGVVVYSGGSYPARPSGFASVRYIGPVQPTSWQVNDEWVDNS